MVKLTDYMKRGSRYLRAEDLKGGDVTEVTIVSEGRIRPAEESRFGRETFELDVRLPSGEEKIWTLNQTTIRRLIEAYGDDTAGWVGKKVRLVVERMVVRKEPRNVIFGYPVGGEEEQVKQFLLKEVRSFYPDRIDLDTLGRLMRSIRGFKTSPEEAAKMAGLKIVEEGGKKYVVFK
jgi:hypothetical protein